nr:unnamed protein product [Digitaria exilis]
MAGPGQPRGVSFGGASGRPRVVRRSRASQSPAYDALVVVVPVPVSDECARARRAPRMKASYYASMPDQPRAPSIHRSLAHAVRCSARPVSHGNRVGYSGECASLQFIR